MEIDLFMLLILLILLIIAVIAIYNQTIKLIKLVKENATQKEKIQTLSDSLKINNTKQEEEKERLTQEFENLANKSAQSHDLNNKPISPSQMAVLAIGPSVNGGTSDLGK